MGEKINYPMHYDSLLNDSETIMNISVIVLKINLLVYIYIYIYIYIK